MDKIAKFYTAKEFRCPESGILYVDSELLTMLDELRRRMGKAVYVTSGCRSEEYNAKIGGSPRSRHITKKGQPCTAADIACVKAGYRYELVKHAIDLGFGGIGIYEAHVHLDTRNIATMWWA